MPIDLFDVVVVDEYDNGASLHAVIPKPEANTQMGDRPHRSRERVPPAKFVSRTAHAKSLAGRAWAAADIEYLPGSRHNGG